MEISTVIGITVGILAVGGGMVLKGANMNVLINPEALLIIFVGTAAALMNAFTMKEIKKFPILLKKLFKKQELMSKSALLHLLVEMSQKARREGLLALEPSLEELADPFLKSGLTMAIDGLDPELVSDVLALDIQLMEERHRSGALIFGQAGMYAPTLGVLGAVIGLIGALGNLKDIDKLGESIAAAFVATMLGIFTGYVMWHPFSNKLKLMSKEEVEMKRMMLEGILSIQSGENPATVEAKLRVFIPVSERERATGEVKENVQEEASVGTS